MVGVTPGAVLACQLLRVTTVLWLTTTSATTSAHRRPEPSTLRRLKQAIIKRWGTVPLIDMLKETVLRTGCLDEVQTLAGKGAMGRDELAERLMLLIYAYGTSGTGHRAPWPPGDFREVGFPGGLG
jgi:hypothetical protein